MTDSRKRLGDSGEAVAAHALIKEGLTISVRNWRCTAGEIDLVAQEIAPDYSNEGQEVPWLVVVEVRTRRGTRYGSALQSITPRKQRKLREVAQHYVQTVNWSGPWRIDVVAVQLDGSGRLLDVEHIRHAVKGE
jgi:putative endonuclease